MSDAAVSVEVKKWLDEIESARKREKDWRKEGGRVLDIYYGNKKDAIPFNILFSNTETLAPALYSTTPRPVVNRRFKDEDPVGKNAAEAGKRGLEYMVDSNTDEYETFDNVLADAVLDALVPGRGASRVKYDFEEGKAGETSVKLKEAVCVESVIWDRIVIGYAKKWKKVPFIAFELHFDQDDAKEEFTAAIAAKMTFTPGEEQAAKHDNGERDDDGSAEGTSERKTALVWQVWDKKKREVLWISPAYKEGICKRLEDPLKLTGFFPIPQPLQFLRKANNQQPGTPYSLYENQAKELNRITVRINRIVEALKVRGVYDSSSADLEQLMKKEDNVLIGATQPALMAGAGGLDKVIWMMPIEKLVVVLQQLYIARDAAKQVIYEITGIADILRGSTVASETATAQSIKAKWGGLRLSKMQKEVQRYARDLLRMMLEIAGEQFDEKTWAQMTGLPFATTQDSEKAKRMVQLAAGAGMQPDPQSAQIAQQPVWGDVLKLLRNDYQRSYRIDIETNSTIEPEAAEDQKAISDLLTALGQYLNGVAPLIQSGAMPFEAAQSMMLTIARRFRFGSEIEDQLKAMKQPPPPNDGKMQAEQAKLQMEQEKHQAEMAKSQQEAVQRDREMQLEFTYKQREHEMKLAEMEAKKQLAAILANIKIEEANAKLAALRAQSTLKLEHQEVSNAQKQQAARDAASASATGGDK